MYFPPSQIETGLTTDGSEYKLASTGEKYIGPYWKVKRGGVLYTGNSPDDPNPIRLYLISQEDAQETVYTEDKRFYSQIQNNKIIGPAPIINAPDVVINKLTVRSIPLPYTPKLTQNDIEKRFITRYFAKRNDSYNYLEISPGFYKKIGQKSDGVAWDQYSIVSLTWVISGDRNNVELGNAQRVKNISMIESPRNPDGKNWIGFETIFNNNYLQFFQSNKSKTQSNRTTPTSTPPQQSSTSGGSGGGGY